MGVEDKIVFDLVDVVEGRCRLKQALVQDVRFSGRLALLPAAQTRDKDTVSAQQMRQVVVELAEQFDYVLIDCPAGIEQGFKNAVAGSGPGHRGDHAGNLRRSRRGPRDWPAAGL